MENYIDEVYLPYEESGDEKLFETLQKNPNEALIKGLNAKGKKFYIRESFFYLKIRTLPKSETLLRLMKTKLNSCVIRDLTK